MKVNQPRGIRNHNPGNIDYSLATKWQGAATPPYETTNSGERGRFARFTAPEWGIRAIARVLITYQDKHDLKTVRSIIDRWAPPSENDTSSYAKSVAAKLKVSPDDAIDVYEYDTMRVLVEAIIQHENGVQPYPPAVIDEGLRRAGVVPKPRAAALKTSLSAEGIGTGTAGVGLAGSALTEAAQQLNIASPEGSQVFAVVSAVLLTAGVLLTVWGLVQQAKRRSSQ